MEGPLPSPAEAGGDWLLMLRAAGCSEHTVEGRRRLLARFRRCCDGQLAVSPSEAASWLASQCVSRNSLSQYATVLRLFYRHCKAQGWVPINPFEALPRPRYRNPPIYPLTLDEVRRALAVATLRAADIIIILVSTGMRAGELAGVRPGDIDEDRQLVRVRGKGGSDRMLALGDRAAAALRRQAGCLTYGIIAEEMRRVRWKARLPGFRAHRLRHTFAVEYLRGEGARLDLLQQLLGHKSIAATMIYLAVETQEEAWESQRALNVGDRL